MADFQYHAKTPAGETVTGRISADSEAVALRLLADRNLFPLDPSDPTTATRRQPARQRVRGRDIGILYGQLADLLGAGVPLLRALDSLIRSTVNKRLAAVLKEIRASVADGRSLTDSLLLFLSSPTTPHRDGPGRRTREFPRRRAPQSLGIPRTPRRTPQQGHRLHDLPGPPRQRRRGRPRRSPALLRAPFEPLLGDAPKPLPTELVFALSRTLRSAWYLLALAAVGALAWGAFSSERGRRLFDERRLRVPVIGDALRLLAITRFCRILGTMLANGVPILQALAISRGATGSRVLAERITDAMENVRGGKPLTDPLRRGGYFPEQILAMIRVAKESNRLDKVLLTIADTVERRTNRQVDQAVRLLEPLILCLVALAIGFLALGLLLPIFTMASNLGRS